MMIKYIVTGSLLVSLGAMGAIFIASLALAGSGMGVEIPETSDDLVVVDSSGNEIEGAKVIQKEDGTTALVTEDGKEIKDAEVKEVEADGKDKDSEKPKSPDSPTRPGGGSGSKPSPQPSPKPSNPSPSPTPTPPPTPKPSQPSPPPPPPPACGSGGACTATQVAAHNSPSNCWVIYSGKVYDVTPFVSRHEGGRSVFNSNTCGRDIGAYLNGQREPVSGERFNHSSSNIREINTYYIAELS